MATSFIKKSMAYLGLVDDYDDYDEYGSRPAPVADRPRPVAAESEDEVPAARPTRIRVASGSGPTSQAATVQQGPSARPSPSPSVKVSKPESSARVHIVAPARFSDAVEIANRLMGNQPVIVNMQTADRDLQRRMIDFCSGVTYALSGGMERVADEVFLLTPSNVKVSDEERQRLAGLVGS